MAMKRISAALVSAAFVSSLLTAPAAFAEETAVDGVAGLTYEVVKPPSNEEHAADKFGDAKVTKVGDNLVVENSTVVRAGEETPTAYVTLTIAKDAKLDFNQLQVGDNVKLIVTNSDDGDGNPGLLRVKEIVGDEQDSVPGTAALSPLVYYQLAKLQVTGGNANTIPLNIDSAKLPGEVKAISNGATAYPVDVLVHKGSTYYVPAGAIGTATTFNVAISQQGKVSGAYTQDITVVNKGDKTEQWYGDITDRDEAKNTLPKVQIKSMTSPVGGLDVYVLKNIGQNLVLNDQVCKGQAQVGWVSAEGEIDIKNLGSQLKPWDAKNAPTKAGNYIIAPIYNGNDCWIEYTDLNTVKDNIDPAALIEAPAALKKFDLQNFSVKKVIKDYLSSGKESDTRNKLLLSLIGLLAVLGFAALLGNTVVIGGGKPQA